MLHQLLKPPVFVAAEAGTHNLPTSSTQPLKTFIFGSIEVRTVTLDGEAWFVASDVAKALDYRDAANMVRLLDDDEAGTRIVRTRSENGVEQDREVTIISESGLYHAVFKSRKPEANPFRKWVTAEVLPAIRRDGGYIHDQATPAQLAGLQQIVETQLQKLRTLDDQNRCLTLSLQDKTDLANSLRTQLDRADEALSLKDTLLEETLAEDRMYFVIQNLENKAVIKYVRKLEKDLAKYTQMAGEASKALRRLFRYRDAHSQLLEIVDDMAKLVKDKGKAKPLVAKANALDLERLG